MLPDLLYDLLGKPGPSCDIPAVFVLPNVGKTGKKLVDQIPVGAVDLN